VTRLAVLALESPERIGLEAARILDGGPESQGGPEEKRHLLQQWLLLLAAVFYSRPDLANAAAIAHLEALLRDSDLGPDTCRMAGEVLKFAINSPVGREAIDAAMRLLSEPNHRREVYQAVIDSLRWAAGWAMDLLDSEALLRIAAMDSLAPYRGSLLRDIVEPCLYAAERLPSDLSRRLMQLYAEVEPAKYCAYYLQGKTGLPEELHDRFRLHGPVANRLGRGRRRILVVHNIGDRQGDEIVRIVPLAQALLDFNLELEIVLLTRRVYLYAHPRITAIPIGEQGRVAEVFREHFDGLVDFFEPDVKQVNYDPKIEMAVDEFRQRCRPFLDIGSRKGYNHFLYERVEVDSQPLAAALGLDRRRVDNNYEPTLRLIAELGLPLRRGQDMPRSEPVLTGGSWPEAEAFWRTLTAGNQESRPVALLLPFGGAEPLKGYVSREGVAAEIRSLVREGFYVVVIPTGASWGTTGFAQDAVSLLPPDERLFVAVGPAPDASAGTIPAEVAGGTSLPFADVVMRLVIYGIQLADLVAAVEGWMMHAAYCLGKAYRVLMLAYSHPVEWHPYGRTRHQGIFPAAGFPAKDIIDGAPLLEQPRKFVFLFLLRELGNAGWEDALPILRRALASEDRHIRLAAAEALARHWNSGAEDLLAPLLRDSSHQVRGLAAREFLNHSVTPRGVPREHLQAHAWIGQTERNWESVLRLGEAARPVLELAAKGDDPVIEIEATRALGILDFKPSRDRQVPEGIVSRIGRRYKDMFKPWGFVRAKPQQTEMPKVLILTPVKDAAAFIPGYYKRITRLSYPGKLISLGFLESDSIDGTHAELQDRLPRLRKKFRRAGLWKKDFGFQTPAGVPRWEEHIQAERRTVLAKSRNHLLFHALDDEDWVLWLDVDVIEYPDDILERMLATGKDIVQPHCVLDYGGPTFDRNAWRDHGRLHLEDLREEGELVKLDAVGGTMLLVRADLHREGLIFPSWPYGKASASARASGELETEGLGIMALDMGYQCWGMPHLEVRHGKW
jgi:hypothetical protein